jgi:hypothetical protein
MRCHSVGCGMATQAHRSRNRLREIRSRSHRAVIRVYDAAGNVIETHEQAGEFDVMLTYALGPSASTSIGTPSHFAAALRSWKTRTLIEEPLVSKASNRA